MKCLICGAQVPSGVEDCPSCGSPSPGIGFGHIEPLPDRTSRSRMGGERGLTTVTTATEDFLAPPVERMRTHAQAEWEDSGE
jgi:hypothetical protein